MKWENMLNLLIYMIEIPSTNDNLSAQRELAFSLGDMLKELGLSVRLLPLRASDNLKLSPSDKNRYIIYAYSSEKAPVLLYGHYDVVPSFGWNQAFQPKVIDNKVIGRGANDMKGGIAAVIWALKELRDELGVIPPVKVLLVPDEEEWSKGAWVLVKSYNDLFKDVKLIIVTEIGDERNNVSILAGRRGRLTFHLELRGHPYHGAQPTKGINPIWKLPDFLKALQRIPTFFDNEMGLPDSLTPLHLSTPSAQLTIPDKLELTIDFHYTSKFLKENHLTPSEPEGILSWLQWQMRNLDGFYLKLVERPTPFPTIWLENREKIRKLLRGSLLKKLPIYYGLSVADENVLTLLKTQYPKLTIIDICPVGSNSHSHNEWVSISSLDEVKELIKSLIRVLD